MKRNLLVLSLLAVSLTGCNTPNSGVSASTLAEFETAIHMAVTNGITDFQAISSTPAVSNAITHAIGDAVTASKPK